MDGLFRLALGYWLLPVYGIKILLITGAMAWICYPRGMALRQRLLALLIFFISVFALGLAYEPAFPYLGRTAALFLGIAFFSGAVAQQAWLLQCLKALILTAILMPAQILSFEIYAQLVMRPRYIGYSPVQYLAFHLFDTALAILMITVFWRFSRAGLFEGIDRRVAALLSGGAIGILLLFYYYIGQYGLVGMPMNRQHVLMVSYAFFVFLLFLLNGLFFQNKRLASMLFRTE